MASKSWPQGRTKSGKSTLSRRLSMPCPVRLVSAHVSPCSRMLVVNAPFWHGLRNFTASEC